MEMDSYKTPILDGVLVQNKDVRAGVSNCMHQCLNFFGTKRTHSHVPGLKGEALFLEHKVFFVVSANRRLVQICIY